MIRSVEEDMSASGYYTGVFSGPYVTLRMFFMAQAGFTYRRG